MGERDEHDHSFRLQVPEGDNRERRVCEACGFIDYENPKVVVGAVATWEGRILLCRRAIEPRRGYWTIPAGFLEMHESAAEGAARETREEAGAEIEVRDLLALYEVTGIGQLYLIFRARLCRPTIEAGEESLEVGLFRWDEIPWQELAFPTVLWSLRHHREVEGVDRFPPFTNPGKLER
jgi:ADP-ribose pyrophosphatase YjhB (NUDIX family)